LENGRSGRLVSLSSPDASAAKRIAGSGAGVDGLRRPVYVLGRRFTQPTRLRRLLIRSWSLPPPS